MGRRGGGLSRLRLGGGGLQHAEDVAFLHDQKVFAIDLHLGARPFAEQDAIAGLHVEGMDLTAFIAGAGAGRDDLAFLRLFLGGIGNDDAALGFCFFFDAFDENAIAKRTKRPIVSP